MPSFSGDIDRLFSAGIQPYFVASVSYDATIQPSVYAMAIKGHFREMGISDTQADELVPGALDMVTRYNANTWRACEQIVDGMGL